MGKNSGETFCRFAEMCKSGVSWQRHQNWNSSVIPEHHCHLLRNITAASMMMSTFQMFRHSSPLRSEVIIHLADGPTHYSSGFLKILWLPPLQRKLLSCPFTGWSSRPILSTNLSLLITAEKRHLMRTGASKYFHQ